MEIKVTPLASDGAREGGPAEGQPEAGARQELVLKARKAAARYLERFGYEILACDWECPAGKADIVARDCDALVFVKVDARTKIERGFPVESLTTEDRCEWEKIAMWYLRDCDFVDVPVRFDVVALMVVAANKAMIRHYVNALGEA